MNDEITRLRRQRDFWVRQAMAFSEHADNMRIALLEMIPPTLCEPDPSVGVAGMDPATDRKSAATCRACAGSCDQPFDSAPITNNDAATGEPGGGVGFSPGSSGGPINRSAERQSPDRECGESQRRDVPQPDNGRAAGGPAHKSMIDVEEVLGELHSLAESGEGSRCEVRRTAATAASAIDLLRAWVNELQWSKMEIDSLQHVVEDGRLVDLSDYGRLRSLLVRLRPEWEDEDDPREGADPVAWAVMRDDWYHGVYLIESAANTFARRLNDTLDKQPVCVVPLYRQPQPTITDGEYKSLGAAIEKLQPMIGMSYVVDDLIRIRGKVK